MTRLQNFIEAGYGKVEDILLRFNKLPDIFNKYESAQGELECLREADYTGDREEFEIQYYQVEAKISELLASSSTSTRPSKFLPVSIPHAIIHPVGIRRHSEGRVQLPHSHRRTIRRAGGLSACDT